MHFGSTLRVLRLDAGVSLRELARRIGVSSAYLSRVENGHDPTPTVDRIAAIAQALGLSRTLLLELAGQGDLAVVGYMNRVPAAQAVVLDLARRELGPTQLARVRAFLDQEFPLDRETPTLRLCDYLVETRVLLGVVCADMEDLVMSAVARLPSVPSRPAAELVRQILAREKAQPSFLGGGIVVPHLRVPVDQTWVVLSLLARPLVAPTPDRQLVRVCVLIVGGLEGAASLELISRVARLAAAGVLDELEHAGSPKEVLCLLRNLENSW